MPLLMLITRSTASAPRTRTAEVRRQAPDRGVAIVGTLVGFAIFLTLLLFSAQVLVRLYATSALTSAATRAAETVAQATDPESEVGPAEATARASLGTYGTAHTAFIWREVDGQAVVLEVIAPGPGLLPLPSSWRQIRRTVTVRTERFR